MRSLSRTCVPQLPGIEVLQVGSLDDACVIGISPSIAAQSTAPPAGYRFAE